MSTVKKLRIEFPEKTFFQAPPGGTCLQMKKITLELVFDSLKNDQFKVTVPEHIRVKAKMALDKMLNVA